MKLVYRLLSEDLIEKWGAMPAPDSTESTALLREELCRRIANATGVDAGMVSRTLLGLLEKGYLRAAIAGGACRWHWTHNNRADDGSAME
jgi:hypothetical protein